jgi:hypothetical protein
MCPLGGSWDAGSHLRELRRSPSGEPQDRQVSDVFLFVFCGSGFFCWLGFILFFLLQKLKRVVFIAVRALVVFLFNNK